MMNTEYTRDKTTFLRKSISNYFYFAFFFVFFMALVISILNNLKDKYNRYNSKS